MKKMAIVLLVMLMICVISSNAFAAQNNSIQPAQNSTIELIKQRMDTLGIEKNTQDALFDKLRKGIPLDSENPQLVSEELEKLIKSPGSQEEIIVFPDGSRIRIGKELVKSHVTILDKSGGLITPQALIIEGTYRVYAEGSFTYGSFFADTLRNLDWNEARIVQIYNENYYVISGTYSNFYWGIVKSTYSYGSPARAEMRYNYVVYEPVNGTPLWSGLFKIYINVTPTAVNTYSSGVI